MRLWIKYLDRVEENQNTVRQRTERARGRCLWGDGGGGAVMSKCDKQHVEERADGRPLWDTSVKGEGIEWIGISFRLGLSDHR